MHVDSFALLIQRFFFFFNLDGFLGVSEVGTQRVLSIDQNQTFPYLDLQYNF